MILTSATARRFQHCYCNIDSSGQVFDWKEHPIVYQMYNNAALADRTEAARFPSSCRTKQGTVFNMLTGPSQP